MDRIPDTRNISTLFTEVDAALKARKLTRVVVPQIPYLHFYLLFIWPAKKPRTLGVGDPVIVLARFQARSVVKCHSLQPFKLA